MPGKQVWFTPSRVRISLPPPSMEEVRHRRGHRLESGCRLALSWVRFPLLPPFSTLHWFSMLPTKFMTESCVFCKREVPTRGHHVVPRCKGGTEIVPTCHSCEDFIHKTWSHNELRDTFNSVQSILADARFQRFLKWLQKQHETAVFRSQRGRTRKPGKYS